MKKQKPYVALFFIYRASIDRLGVDTRINEFCFKELNWKRYLH